MRIPIDRESETPLYQQIAGFLRQSILTGSLPAYTRLPSTRTLARDLGLNRITVENAYAVLEAGGLTYSQPGSGTYVQPPGLARGADEPASPGSGSGVIRPVGVIRPAADGWPLWQREIPGLELLAARPPLPAGMTAARPADLINFAGGGGDARLFPVEDYRRIIQGVLKRDGMDALDYGEQPGYPPLRATIAQILASQGIPVQADEVLVTAGSQQAIALVTQLLLQPGDAILVETPTYAVALDLFRAQRLRVVGIPTDKQGMQVEKLEKLLQQHHPRLIYTIPNFHNPTGACMSGHRRRMLIDLADRYNLPVLEDDYVGDLRYEGRALPALKSLDPGGRVIYASTFSKMLMPGLRVGFIAAQGPVYQALVRYKHINDLSTSNLHQRALESYVTVGRYQSHLRRTVQLYRKRRDAMLEAVHRHLPAAVQVEPPSGGLFMWLRLPDGVDENALLAEALAAGVSFTPGSRFFWEGSEPGAGYMRLNFASQPPDAIEEGIRRLGQAMRRVG